jgi:hypothetical protein
LSQSPIALTVTAPTSANSRNTSAWRAGSTLNPYACSAARALSKNVAANLRLPASTNTRATCSWNVGNTDGALRSSVRASST